MTSVIGVRAPARGSENFCHVHAAAKMIEEFFTGDDRIRGKPEVSLFPDLGNFRGKIVFEG